MYKRTLQHAGILVQLHLTSDVTVLVEWTTGRLTKTLRSYVRESTLFPLIKTYGRKIMCCALFLFTLQLARQLMA